jgi:cytochrome c oxidase subunit I+III
MNVVARTPIPTISAPDAASHHPLERLWGRAPGFIGWLCSTNHKDIGLRYIVTAFIFFGLAGILALLMRIQLAFPELHFIGPDLYNQIFTVHGSTMMFLFAVPVMEGIAIYFVPLMVGTRNVAFPRLNAFGYFAYVAGGLLLWGGLFTNTGADVGWFAYVPLSGPQFSPGHRVDVWADMITLTEISALVGAVQVITTVFKQRAPGMSLNRLPMFVWAQVVASFMVIFAMPSVMIASGFLAMDRLAHVNTHFFNPAEGGDALLYQHLFWFFGHPEVYIIFIPATGFVSTMIETFSGRRIFGYTALVLSLIATAFIGFGLWVHHMFATPLPNLGRSFFTASSMMIAIPNGVQLFCWIATLWSGPRLRRAARIPTPLWFVLGFFFIFMMGGLTGIILASIPLDIQVHDTYFVVAHFHYVLIGGAVFPLFGAFYYWFPKWTGRMLNESLGRWNFWTLFFGFNIAFFPMHILGLKGMTRRIYTYVAETGWGNLNLLATIGAGIIGVSVLLFLINVFVSRKRGDSAEANPWFAPSLEWAIPSPPPAYNYYFLPTVRGGHALWENPEEQPVVVGLSTEKREVLNTTIMDAEPEHRYELAVDSIWPVVLAIVVGLTMTWFIFSPWAIPGGAFASMLVLWAWFWRGTEPKHLIESAEGHTAPEDVPEEPATA